MKHNQANLPPLSKRVRPQNLNKFAGQKSLLSKKGLLTIAVQHGKLFSMILWGPPGSGKTTLAKIISQSCNYAYYELSAVSSGVKDLRKVLEKGKEYPLLNKPVLLFIDEIHTIVGAGATSGGSMDASNILKPFLSNGSIRCIGSTTYKEYTNYLDKDKAFSRRFQKIDIAEP